MKKIKNDNFSLSDSNLDPPLEDPVDDPLDPEIEDIPLTNETPNESSANQTAETTESAN